MKLCRRGLHEQTPENTLPGGRGCKKCKRIYEAERNRNKPPPEKPEKPKLPNPFQEHYDYGLAIVEARRAKTKATIRAYMDAQQARIDSMTEREQRQLQFLAVARTHRAA